MRNRWKAGSLLDSSRLSIDGVTISISNHRRGMMAAYKFEIYKDKSGEFRFRFRAPNGEKMFSSEGYSSKASATGTIRSIVKHVGAAEINDLSKAAPKVAAAKKTKKARKAKKAKK
jgi:uncharacterized protein YegP (UPF0339 family)